MQTFKKGVGNFRCFTEGVQILKKSFFWGGGGPEFGV